MKRADQAFLSIMALIHFYALPSTLASNSLPAGCDSDCVVTCFSNNKQWENKCLAICGCQGDCPVLSAEFQSKLISDQQFNDQIQVAPNCDKTCFTDCAIKQSKSNETSDYSECWVGCNCTIKSQALQSSEFQSKIEEAGISLGLVAGIFWIVIIVIAVILWCKCYSSQSRYAEVGGPRTDVYYLMKEQEEEHTPEQEHDMFREESPIAMNEYSRQFSMSAPHQSQPPADMKPRPKSSLSQI